jgi:hypothetical protein
MICMGSDRAGGAGLDVAAAVSLEMEDAERLALRHAVLLRSGDDLPLHRRLRIAEGRLDIHHELRTVEGSRTAEVGLIETRRGEARQPE